MRKFRLCVERAIAWLSSVMAFTTLLLHGAVVRHTCSFTRLSKDDDISKAAAATKDGDSCPTAKDPGSSCKQRQ